MLIRISWWHNPPPLPPGLIDLGLLDPGVFATGAGNYTYQASVTTDLSSFTATATNPGGNITITINETGVVTPTGIVLGFQ